MTNALRKTVVVQPGGRIELEAPELSPGATAEVIILFEAPPPGRRLTSLIGAASGSFSTPEEVDTFIRKERDAWER